jgi:NADH-quinone oxidoreductase subunit M
MFLTLLIFLPLVFAILLGFFPERLIRPVSLVLALLHFAYSLLLFVQFDPSKVSFQLVEQAPWLPTYGINYFVGIDGISFWLVLLTTFFTPIVILASWTSISERVRSFHVCVFMLATTMLGTFLALDAVLFYTFFEASLIPMYLMIGIWGGSRRLYATMKFFIYTFFGSLFMLVALITLIFMTQEQFGHLSASLLDFYHLKIPFVAHQFFNTQTLLFFCFALAFAIKIPLFPFHTWLPDAHVEAPTPGSVILAAVMLKMGTYGYMRFVIPLFPSAAEYFTPLILTLAVVGIIYGALVAMVQTDIKKLVAYSSVSHMGYVMLGLFAMNSYGVTGSLYQMLNHGISTGALFLLVGMIYERTHSREIKQYGGLAMAAPIFTIFFLIVTFSSIAVPMTNGFIGEFLILLGGFGANKLAACLAVSGVVLGAVYMLWMVKRVFFGMPGPLVAASVPKEHGHGHSHGHVHASHDHDHSHRNGHGGGLDINIREICVLVPFVILIFWMGLFPDHFLRWSRASVENFVQNHSNYELNVER